MIRQTPTLNLMALSGEWRVASGEWRVASGGWRVAGGEWQVNVIKLVEREHRLSAEAHAFRAVAYTCTA